MKILERGDVPFKLQIRCELVTDSNGFSYNGNYCSSLLEIDNKDICAVEWFKYPNYTGNTDYGVICPVCGSFIHIKDKNIIPINVRNNAPYVTISDINKNIENMNKKILNKKGD